MNRVLPIAAAVLGGLVLLGGAWLSFAPAPSAPEPAPAPEPVVVAPTPPPAPPAPAAIERRENRIALASGRTLRDDLPMMRLADLDDPKAVHRQAIDEIRAKVLQPCVPRPSLKDDNITRRIEVDYRLQPSGIVEIQLRGVDADRAEAEIDGGLLDCFASRVGQIEGPTAQGDLSHRFVYAYLEPTVPLSARPRSPSRSAPR